MKHVTYIAIILENVQGDVLLLLRDNTLDMTRPKHWTLICGQVPEAETPEMAASRELGAETGLKMDLSFWKHYEREHPLFLIDQLVYVAKIEAPHDLPVPGPDMQFVKPGEVEHLDIGYGFDSLLREYFLIRER